MKLWFQSHTGTITTKTQKIFMLIRFVFQSHTGTITTSRRPIGDPLRSSFQSHTGTITTAAACDSSRSRRAVSIPHRYDYDGKHEPGILNVPESFNPTQVRLRLLRERLREHSYDCFNPTQVRLRPRRCKLKSKWAISFNPTQVRLRRQRGSLPRRQV